MTNLYDFLRHILAAATRSKTGSYDHTNMLRISREEWDWLRHYLTKEDTVINFKSYKTGKLVPIVVEDPAVAQRYLDEGYQIDGKPAEPEVSFDLALAGRPDDVFCLLTEGMMQNPNFANIVIGASSFYKEHVPTCPLCEQNHNGKYPHDCPDLYNFTGGWDFHKRKNVSHETERQTDSQRKAAGDLGTDQADTGGQ